MGVCVQILQSRTWADLLEHMHTHQADLERSERDRTESKKVSALAGRGRVHMPRACALRAFANAGVCTMQARDGYVGEWKAGRGDSRDGK